MRRSTIALLALGACLSAVYAVAVHAEPDDSAICCETDSECMNTAFPLCFQVGVDCDGAEGHLNHYCMKKPPAGLE